MGSDYTIIFINKAHISQLNKYIYEIPCGSYGQMYLKTKSAVTSENISTKDDKKGNTVAMEQALNRNVKREASPRQSAKGIAEGINLTLLDSQADKTHYTHVLRINNNLSSSKRT